MIKIRSFHQLAAQLAATTAVLAFVFWTAQAPLGAAIAPEDAARILPVSKIRPGMRGYGLTVFRGDTVSRFDVKVIDVMPNMINGKPLILVRVGGGELSRRNIMIAAGMSGSPVYIGGKLIGAVAYAGDFATEPVGMVTPIEEMLEAWDPGLDKPTAPANQTIPLVRPVTIGGKSITSVGIGERPASDTSPGSAWFRPLSMPIFCSGLSQRSMDLLNEKLGDRRMRLMPGPGRMAPGAGGKGSAKLVEGGAIGFSMVTGDLDLSGIGTVTYIKGNKVLAFGHPMMGLGSVEMPMSAAWVHDVYTSLWVSYKMASPTAIVGSLVQDRPFSVAGDVGRKAAMVPVEVAIREGSGGAPKIFRAQVFRHPMFTSLFASMAVDEAIFRQRPYPGDAIARVSFSVSAKGAGTITRNNVYFTKGLISTAACADLDSLLSLMRSNKFGQVDVDSIKMDVELLDARQTAEIEQIRLDRQTYEPGETARATVMVRPYNAEPVAREISIQIPADAPDGRATVMIQGAGAVSAMGGLAELMSGSPGMEDLRNAASIKQLLERYSKLETNNQIVARLTLPTTSFSINGERLTGLPPSMETALAAARSARTRVLRNEVVQRQDTDWVVGGMDAVPITIARKRFSPAKPRPASALAPSAAGDEEESASPPVAPAKPTEAPAAAWDIPQLQPAAAGDDDTEVVEVAAASKAAQDKPAAASDTVKTKDEAAADVAALPALGRAAKQWVVASPTEFSKGASSGIAVSGTGALGLGLTSTSAADLQVENVWALSAAPDGTVYAATGNGGRVSKISADGKHEELFRTGGALASSVAVDSGGRVWAGSSPDGAIWVWEGGKAREVAKLTTRHPVGLVATADGAIVGAGDSGKIWKVSADGSTQLLADTGQEHVQALAPAADGTVYAATAGASGGLLWKVSGSKAEAVASAQEGYFASVVVAPWGAIYATSGPRGKLYKIESGKSPVVLVEKLAASVTPLAATASAVVAADNNKLRIIRPDDTVWEQDLSERVTLYAAASDGRLVTIGTSTGGRLLRLKPAETGWFESGVQDAGRSARWGSAEVAAFAGSGATLKVRTGEVAEPDSGWSLWKNAASTDTALTGRYAQMRLELTQPAAGPPPEVSALRVSYLADNQAPLVAWAKPAPGDYVSGSRKLQWTGKDQDGDKLVYDLFVSSDQKSWKPLGEEAEEKDDKENTASGKQDEAAESPAAAIEKVDTSKMSDADKKLVESVKASLGGSRTGSTTTNGTSYEWDTSSSPDGVYWLKVVASDARANGAQALSDEAVLGPVHVANAKPVVRLHGKAANADASGAIRISGSGQSKSAPISDVQYRIGSGDWSAAQAVDGLFDQTDESFVISPRKPANGKHTLEVRLTDRAGNKAEAKKEYLFTVPEKAEAKAP